MVWRLPSRFPPLIEDHTLSYTNSEVEDVLKAQGLKSTYQDDYTGLPQGELCKTLQQLQSRTCSSISDHFLLTFIIAFCYNTLLCLLAKASKAV